VKSVSLPQTRGLRGVVANAPTHALYISYGGDGNGQNGTPTMLKYDLLTDAVVWTHTYTIGIDSMSITPDGRFIYMPSGELASVGTWYVIRADTGDVVGTINGPQSPHNTIVNLDGTRVYLGGRAYNYLGVADTSTNQVVRWIGPLVSSVRPFTINGRNTIAYITVTGLRGFQVGDITTGQVLATVGFTGPNVSTLNGPTAPSHGISLSPDERELYVIDWPDYVHVFDVSGVPTRAALQVADIALTPNMNHTESPCVYDCGAGGWLQHSRDGRFVYVGDQGDVIDTATRRAVTNLSPLYQTKKMIEIDWDQGVPVFAANARSSVGYVTTAASPPCGDVNGDGVVNSGDALIVAQYDVRIRSCAGLAHPELCDVNGDGACNIGDALKMVQCDAGVVSCTFTCKPFVCR
jgi:DNA-binding beta-propeller fold protein YncE